MGTVYSSEMSVTFYQPTWCHIPNIIILHTDTDHNSHVCWPQQHCHEALMNKMMYTEVSKQFTRGFVSPHLYFQQSQCWY
jgi:hypothetical protein